MSEVIFIDGKNCLFRMAHVFNALSTEDDFPTGAMFGCLNSMLSLHTRLPEAAIVWVWDGKGETWRHKFMADIPQLNSLPEPDTPTNYIDNMAQASMEFIGANTRRPYERKKKEKKKGYKANRIYSTGAKKQTKYPEDVRGRALLQIPVIRMILEGCGIRNFEVEGLECDDLLAMLAKQFIDLEEDSRVYIHSGDRDYYQLLDWDQVRIVTKVKDGKLHKVRAEDVTQEYGVEVKDWAKFRALTGDSSDNIPHLAKVGEVRAKKMLEAGIDPSIQRYKDLPEEAVEEFGKYFLPLGIERVWPAMHGNYKLCKLVDDPEDEILSEEVRGKLAPMFAHLDSTKRFYRSERYKTAEAFRRISHVLAKYELSSILGRRETLWRIP